MSDITRDSIKYTFSGHESFQCRQLWLKKGFDFVSEGFSFTNEDAVVKLGVGKNMVSSIRYWMKAFQIMDADDQLTEIGTRIFDGKTGFDPFLEDEATVWLLHYYLVKTGVASIYSIMFNEFRKEKIYFNRETFINYLKRRKDSHEGFSFNEKTVAEDFDVFTKMYLSQPSAKEIEDSFSGILTEIQLIKSLEKNKETLLQIENAERSDLPVEILLFTILNDERYGNSISLNALEHDENSPGTIFALSRSGLVNKINEMVSKYKYVTFTDHAGIKELQFKSKPSAYQILAEYYGQ